jgi:hypothetical protein
MLKLTFDTISRGGRSLLEQLATLTPRPFDYISFHCLRNWNVLSNGNLVSEQIYVHTKVMIVDDQLVICGSANINDRSMRGTRDSEICAIIEDRNYVDSLMNGKPYKAGSFAFNLRRKLWQQHLGLTDEELDLIKVSASSRLLCFAPLLPLTLFLQQDPNHLSVYRDLWQATSCHNTQILARVFPTSILNPKDQKQQQHESKHLQVGENEFVTELASSLASPSMVVETVEPPSLPLQTQTKLDGTEGKEAASALAEAQKSGPSTSAQMQVSSSPSASPSSSPSFASSTPPSSGIKRLGQSLRKLSSGSNGTSQQVYLEGSEYVGVEGEMTPEAQNLLDMLATLRGFLNDYPLDLFSDEDLDLKGKEMVVPKNVFL